MRIVLSGCDDSTYIDMEVTPVELDFLERLCKESEENGGGCAPVAWIDETGETTWEDDE